MKLRLNKRLMFAIIILFLCITLSPSSAMAENLSTKIALTLDDEVFIIELNDLLVVDESLYYNKSSLNSRLLNVFSEFYQSPKEPYVIRTGDKEIKYEVHEGSLGRSFDTIIVKERILKLVKSHKGLIDRVSFILYEESSQIYPEKRLGYFEFVKENLISSFSTNFNPLDRNRTENLRISTREIDNYIILPGEVFSLNKVLGPRTYAKGYKDAGIFVNGVKSTGIAGGICQTSSTLFNALMLADLDLIERHRHSLPVPYLERGRDAAISARQDLKVLNNSTEPVRIRAFIDTQKGELTVEIYGKEEKRIELATKRSHEGGRNVYRTYKQYLNETDDITEEKLLLKDVI